ncbi:uncharacterized protein LOC142559698 [Dermacentor variabilis]|uniref:uncharacterized protein LOC142559698 n=1 Tax=Dermacentor variabilis TaxID=34621 RepID=UPI003F5B2C0F
MHLRSGKVKKGVVENHTHATTSTMPDKKDQGAPAQDMSSIIAQLTALLEHQTNLTPAASFRLQLAVPTYEGHTDKKSVADFLQGMQDYRDAQAITDDVLLQRVLLVALSGSATRWRRRQSFQCWTHFAQLLRAEFLPPDYVVRMKAELRARTQAEEESLQEYKRSYQELYERADASASETERVTRAIRQSHPRFQAYLRGRTFSSLDDLAKAASDIHAAMLAELTYQPPPPPQASLEPSCAWHGSQIISPGNMVPPPRALDPFIHRTFATQVRFRPPVREPATTLPGTRGCSRPVAAAAQSGAEGTRRSIPVCFQCGGRGHYKSQCPSPPGILQQGNDEGRRW